MGFLIGFRENLFLMVSIGWMDDVDTCCVCVEWMEEGWQLCSGVLLYSTKYGQAYDSESGVIPKG